MPLSEWRTWHSASICHAVALCVCPLRCDCIRIDPFVSAVKVMCCIQCSLVEICCCCRFCCCHLLSLRKYQTCVRWKHKQPVPTVRNSADLKAACCVKYCRLASTKKLSYRIPGWSQNIWLAHRKPVTKIKERLAVYSQSPLEETTVLPKP